MKEISAEELFELNIIQNLALKIVFKKKSKSFKLYGESIVIDLRLDNDTYETLLKNNVLNQKTYRHQMKADLLSNNLTKSQLRLFENEGFNTQDIVKLDALFIPE